MDAANGSQIVAVFTPDNEPYLGRNLLFHLDLLITEILEKNNKVAPRTHGIELTDIQQAGCQLIPQAIGLGLSLRELVRQGYLFGAAVLVRSLMERVVILLYLIRRPTEVEKWQRGWRHDEAPSLAKMVEAISSSPIKGHEVTAVLNDLVHGKPGSAIWGLTRVGQDIMGHAASKILDRPEVCDEISAQAISWLVCVSAMINAYFPGLLDV